MADATTHSESALRKKYKAIPLKIRESNEAWSIRIWRGLSWLKRSEEVADLEGRFISLWIAFNAVYGHMEDQFKSAGDHSSWQWFLARMVENDTDDQLGRITRDDPVPIAKLIDNQYIFRPFWAKHPEWKKLLRKSVQKSLSNTNYGNTIAILEELFERLYVLRSQVFHGAATSGSKLNRPQIKGAINLLSKLLPAMIDIMLTAGPEVDWGELCFPPIKEDGR